MLAAIVGAMAALTGFVVTVTTLVVQMATGSFSARYMRLWYRDRMLKVLLALLVGTLAFSFSLMRRVESNFVPNIGVSVAGVLVVLCLLAFLVFLDRYLHRLRPVAVAALVYQYFRRNFELQIKRGNTPGDLRRRARCRRRGAFIGRPESQGPAPSKRSTSTRWPSGRTSMTA